MKLLGSAQRSYTLLLGHIGKVRHPWLATYKEWGFPGKCPVCLTGFLKDLRMYSYTTYNVSITRPFWAYIRTYTILPFFPVTALVLMSFQFYVSLSSLCWAPSSFAYPLSSLEEQRANPPRGVPRLSLSLFFFSTHTEWGGRCQFLFTFRYLLAR